MTYSIRVLKNSRPEERRRVLLHEFMTLAGFETSDSYGYSSLVLNFISVCSEFDAILSSFPDHSSNEKTFRSAEATIQAGAKHLPVLIQNRADYRRFCVAKGFENFTALYLKDVSYSEWSRENARGGEKGAILLNDDGYIVQVLESPARDNRVIESITCK